VRIASLALTAFVAWPAQAAETVFECSFGATRAMVTLEGERLTYSYGRPGRRPELELSGDRSSGTLSYHRQMYIRGEDQTLRFASGDHSYVVYARWNAPNQHLTHTEPEHIGGGVLVIRRGEIVRDLRCRSGGDMREWPVFFTLPEDPANLTPDDA